MRLCLRAESGCRLGLAIWPRRGVDDAATEGGGEVAVQVPGTDDAVATTGVEDGIVAVDGQAIDAEPVATGRRVGQVEDIAYPLARLLGHVANEGGGTTLMRGGGISSAHGAMCYVRYVSKELVQRAGWFNFLAV